MDDREFKERVFKRLGTMEENMQSTLESMCQAYADMKLLAQLYWMDNRKILMKEEK